MNEITPLELYRAAVRGESLDGMLRMVGNHVAAESGICDVRAVLCDPNGESIRMPPACTDDTAVLLRVPLEDERTLAIVSPSGTDSSAPIILSDELIVAVRESIEHCRARAPAMPVGLARIGSEELSQLIDWSPLPLVCLDPAGTIRAANRRWLEMLEREAAAVVGSSFTTFVHDEDIARFRGCFHTLLETGVRANAAFRLRTARGFAVACEMEAIVARDAFGRVTHICCTARESRGEEAARERLADTERRLASITERIPVTIFQYKVDAAGRHTLEWLSRNAEEVFGRPVDWLTDPTRLFSNLVPEDKPGYFASVEASYRELAPWSHDFRIRRPDDSVAWVRGRSIPTPGPDGSVVWNGILQDVTAEKEAQLALEESRARLAKRERQLRAFARRLEAVREQERSQIAREIHDVIGQSLTAVGFDLQWIRRRDLPEDVAARVERLLEQIDVLDGDARRIGSMLRPRILDALGLIPALERLVSDFQAQYGISTTLDLPDDEPTIDRAAATQLYRIAQEALTNIARHSWATQASIELHVRAGSLTLIVLDNGVGIEHPFDGAESSNGLIGMRERARAIGGDMQLETGDGTRIVVSVPGSPTHD